jgi:hypothetical protein
MFILFRRRQIRARIKELLPEVETAYVEIVNLGDELDREAEEHGRRACCVICKAVSTRLPREVRNMIYDQLYGRLGYNGDLAPI